MADRTTILPITLACLCCVGLAGCTDPGRVPQTKEEITDADIRAKTGFAPGSQEDADALVKAVEATVARTDKAAFQDLLNEPQLANRILAGLDVKEKFRAGFDKGMREGGGLSKLSSEIISTVEAGGDYSFVRHVKKGNEIRPLFRLLLPNLGGVNYHELVVAADATGQPRISDIYIYISGELLSQTIRRLVLPAAAAENKGILARLTGDEAALVRNFSILQKVNERKEAKDFQEAYRLISTLPRQFQKDKTVLLMKLLIAQQIGEEEYLKAIRELEEALPNDPSRDFLSIDLYATQGNHEKVVEAVDRLIAATEDPYLNYLKIDGLTSLGRMDEARAAIEAARAAGVDTLDVRWIELAFLLKSKDHAATAKMLDGIARKFGVEFKEISEIPEYADFVRSAPGKAWMRKHAAAATP